MKRIITVITLLIGGSSLHAMDTKYVTRAKNDTEKVASLVIMSIPTAFQNQLDTNNGILPLTGCMISISPGNEYNLDKSITCHDKQAGSSLLITHPKGMLGLSSSRLAKLPTTNLLNLRANGKAVLEEHEGGEPNSPLLLRALPAERQEVTTDEESKKYFTTIENESRQNVSFIVIPFTDPQDRYPFGTNEELIVQGTWIEAPAYTTITLTEPILLNSDETSSSLLFVFRNHTHQLHHADIMSYYPSTKLRIRKNGRLTLSDRSKDQISVEDENNLTQAVQ